MDNQNQNQQVVGAGKKRAVQASLMVLQSNVFKEELSDNIRDYLEKNLDVLTDGMTPTDIAQKFITVIDSIKMITISCLMNTKISTMDEQVIKQIKRP